MKRYYPRGRDALIAGLFAIGAKEGSIVIFPTYYCMEVVSQVKYYGFIPKLVDIDDNYEYSLKALINILINVKVSCVIFVDTFGFGYSNNHEAIEYCKANLIPFAMDGCHSPLATILDDYARCAAFRFYSCRKIMAGFQLSVLDLNELYASKIPDYPNIELNYFKKAILWINGIFRSFNSFQPILAYILRIYAKNNSSCNELPATKKFAYGMIKPNRRTLLSIDYVCKKWQLNKSVKYYNELNDKISWSIERYVVADEKYFLPLYFIIYTDRQNKLLDYLQKNSVRSCLWPSNLFINDAAIKHTNAYRIFKKSVCIILKNDSKMSVSRIADLINEFHLSAHNE